MESGIRIDGLSGPASFAAPLLRACCSAGATWPGKLKLPEVLRTVCTIDFIAEPGELHAENNIANTRTEMIKTDRFARGEESVFAYSIMNCMPSYIEKNGALRHGYILIRSVSAFHLPCQFACKQKTCDEVHKIRHY